MEQLAKTSNGKSVYQINDRTMRVVTAADDNFDCDEYWYEFSFERNIPKDIRHEVAVNLLAMNMSRIYVISVDIIKVDTVEGHTEAFVFRLTGDDKGRIQKSLKGAM